jgi:ATP-dependent phosphofructokinase / diphosphate-dependent phosphofructokinase
MVRGKLVVGQSGGPTQVINSSLVGVITEALAHPEVTGVYGSLRGITGILSESLVDLGRESKATLELVRRTPGAALGTVRYKLKAEDYARVIGVLAAHDVRYLVYIGGNDSMDTAHQIHRAAQQSAYELQVIGVPKTVDNDLPYTDHCPGYGSAARFVALAVRDSGRDTESMGMSSPVKIVEVMGRNAGWLTASAVLGRQQAGDPPHLLYMPERPVDDTEVDAFGHKMKGGAAEYVADLIQDALGHKVRIDKPNYLQRSFSLACSEVDLEEAYRVGSGAVELALQGRTDVMVTLVRGSGKAYFCDLGSVELAQVANAERLLPDAYINDRGNDVTEAFVQYALPLIGDPLPHLGRLERHPVPARAHQEAS